MVEVGFVLLVVEHVFQQLHNGVAVSVATLVRHGLLNVALEDPLVVLPAHVRDGLEFLNGTLLVAHLTQALGQHKRDARPGLVLFAQQRQSVFQVPRRGFVLLLQDLVLGKNHPGVCLCVVRRVTDTLGLGQGVFRFDLVPGSHVRPAQP